jgi:prepilin-type N-terminal cleavage/methylation domain-containing protein
MEINNSKIKYNKNILKNRGLTLVELMVVIAIFLIITSVVIFDYGSFRSNVSLQNLTDDVALSVRKAQSFAIGVRGVNSNSGNFSFSDSYGMHFSIGKTPEGEFSGYNKSFLMFSSGKSTEKKYDYDPTSHVCDGVASTCMESFKITSLDIIKDIIIDGNSSIGNGDSDSSVDIVFTRPNPRAEFCYTKTSGADCETPMPSSVGIVISNGQIDDKEKTRTISVQNTGQISIQ